jgi:exosome complex RNA-binding protein Csl4
MSAHVVGVVCCTILLFTGYAWGEGKPAQKTKTIVGDLLDIDRDLYIVRGERGEIQIEATYKTEVTEEFEFGDRIKALVLMNNRALKIERAGPNDVPGVVENQAAVVKGFPTKKAEKGKAKPAVPVQSPQPKQPDQRIIIADLLDIDRDLYIVRGEYGEIQIEATYKTEVTEEFEFGDRIKALVLKNNRAIKIERAGPNDVLGITILQGAPVPVSEKAEAKPSQQSGAKDQAAKPAKDAVGRPPSDTRVVEGQILMVDGDFYILRGDLGEIRVERTEKTKVSEEFEFGDFIKAIVKKNDQAITIERLK